MRLLLASLMKLQEDVDGKIGAVKGEVDVQGKSMIEVLETLAAERKAADDDRKQVQTRLESVRSDVEAVQAQSAKQAETVSGLLVKVADFEGVKPAVQADMEQLKRQMAEEAQGVAGRVESLQAALEQSGKENEGLLSHAVCCASGALPADVTHSTPAVSPPPAYRFAYGRHGQPQLQP